MIRSKATCSAFCLLALAAAMLPSAVPAQAPHLETGRTIHWVCSTADHPWTRQPDIAAGRIVPVPDPDTPRSLILVSSRRREQLIQGWGGCFNERGWQALQSLPQAARDQVMRSLFDPRDGLKLTLCRTPIGASDYAVAPYSLDETPGDTAMAHFSIDRDKELLIPYIKAALAIRPDLKLWAVPWSPPSWMKSNNSLIQGGNIEGDPKTMDALALYFVRYVEAYRAEGVPISIVMPQNEPAITSNYPSCQWTSMQLAHFIGGHLGPALRRAGLGTAVYLGTIQDSQRGGYDYWVAPALQDAAARKYVSGVACQWGGDVTMIETHFLHPDLALMQSEAECGRTNSNDWPFAEYQYELAKKWFAAGAGSNIVWNMVLDQTGLSTGGWHQCSPIVVNTDTKTVIDTPYYYLYKHFSYFVQPGARVIGTAGAYSDRIAFVNPGGEVIVVMANSADTAAPVALSIDGIQSATVSLPAHSFNTFTLPA